MEKAKHRLRNCMYWLGAAGLFLYAFRHVTYGVDLWDAGYHYSNFAYADLDHMDSMWFFATWGANMVGRLLMHLPFAQTMLGMNLYTAAIVGMIAVGGYVFSVKKLGLPELPALVAQLGALSLCWAPSALLYHYLTYGLLALGALLLYQGVLHNRNLYLILAGVVLGLNVGVRFSNLVQMGLIVLVWYYGILRKKSFREIAKQTGWCVLGYMGAFGGFLLLQGCLYGLDAYIEGISRLFSMTGYASDYRADSMLMAVLGSYYEGTYWLKRIAVVGAMAVLLCLVLPRRMEKLGRVLTIVLTAGLGVWLWQLGFCYGDYTRYMAVESPTVVLLCCAMGLALWFLVRKESTYTQRLQGLLLLALVAVGSLGSNNGFYSTMNNLFLILPFFFLLIYEFCREEKGRAAYPMKAMALLLVGLWGIQAFRFGVGFVYEEADGGRQMTAQIQEIPALRGMHTTPEKAGQLEELYLYLEDADLRDRKVLLYGNIPGLSYYMGLEPAMNVWSDLRSYSVELFGEKLEGLDGAMVILEADCVQYLEEGTLCPLLEDANARQKLEILGENLVRERYQRTFLNEKYAVYLK